MIEGVIGYCLSLSLTKDRDAFIKVKLHNDTFTNTNHTPVKYDQLHSFPLPIVLSGQLLWMYVEICMIYDRERHMRDMNRQHVII